MANLSLITCIVQKGYADAVYAAALEAGASAATISEARGSGIREKLGELGQFIKEEKEVIKIVINNKQKKFVFDALVKAANLDQPGRGLAYIHPIKEAAGVYM